MEPIAAWNPARGAWETAETNLLCGHSALYSETWPTSGSMRNGCLYPPLKSERPTAASGCSSLPGLLPTLQAHDKHGAKTPEQVAAMRARGAGVRNLNEAVRNELLLRTPTAQLAENGGSQHPDKRKAGGHGPTLADQVEHELTTTSNGSSGGSLQLLPTPSVAIATGGQLSRSGNRIDEMLLTGIARAAADGLLPTPSAQNSHGNANRSDGSLPLPGLVQALSSGDRIPSRSADGSTSPAGLRHVQLSLDGLESD